MALDSQTAQKLADLHAHLTQLESQPNTLTVKEFERFTPLYREDTLTSKTLDTKALDKLSEELMGIIDPYKETIIIVSHTDRRIVGRLPKIFNPARSLAPGERSAAIVSTNTGLRDSLPTYSAQAFSALASELLGAQISSENFEAIQKAREEYKVTVTEFNTANGVTSAEMDTPPLATEELWEFDE